MSEYKILYDNNSNRVFLKKTGNPTSINNENKKKEYENNIQKIKELSKNNNSNSENFLEINAESFFQKFIPKQDNYNNNNNNNNNNDFNMISGPRGMPGMVGPQGPPGPTGPSGPPGPPGKNLIKQEDINSLLNSSEIKKIIDQKSNNKNKLIYGIKKTNFTEAPSYMSNSDINFRIKENNFVDNKILFDVFYLSPNILEVIGNFDKNFINDKKVEVFNNYYNNNDIEYFPLNYIPSGFPINFKSNVINYKELVITNISWNIMQNIKNYEMDEINLVGYVPNGNEYVLNDIELDIIFELHSHVPYDKIQNREYIFPYRNKFIKALNPSDTCILSTFNSKVRIGELNGFCEKIIRIPITNHKNLTSCLLCTKIKLTDHSINYLKGHDKDFGTSYGFVPFNQIIISLDYYLNE